MPLLSAPALTIHLQTFRVAHLKRIAVALGLHTSGTKPLLGARIASHLTQRDAPVPRRILSIDMGVRNLAFCVLSVPPRYEQVPRLHAWERVSLNAPDEFSPAAYAVHANRLVQSLVAAHRSVDTVLIERQRWRSGNAATILEWTVRVNSLEAMLHAVFACMRELSALMPEPWRAQVVSVDPKAVKNFWAETSAEEMSLEATAAISQLTGKQKPAEVKKAKTAVVREWLKHGNMVELGSKVRDTAALFGFKRADKLDDLADCLLQAMAWVRWERNRETWSSEQGLPASFIAQVNPPKRRAREA